MVHPETRIASLYCLFPEQLQRALLVLKVT